jgi:lysyl-tRNA synthetase class II
MINDLRSTKKPDPYPHKFQTTMAIPDFIEKFEHLKRGELLQETEVALAGRIMVKRDANKLKFYDLHGEVSSTHSNVNSRAPKSKSQHKFNIPNLRKRGKSMISFVEEILSESVDSLVVRTPKAKQQPEKEN